MNPDSVVSLLGYALLIVGLLVLAFTFLIGYGLYRSLGSAQPQQSNVQNAKSINASVGDALQSIVSGLAGNEYTIMEIIVLFLFASIGYKIAMLGVNLVRGPDIKMVKEKEEHSKDPEDTKYD